MQRQAVRRGEAVGDHPRNRSLVEDSLLLFDKIIGWAPQNWLCRSLTPFGLQLLKRLQRQQKYG